MNPSFDEMEQKRQAMIASFQELAQAMTKCASVVNDFARHAPSIGLNLPTIPVPTINPAASAPATKKTKAASAAPPPAPAAAAETEVDSSSITAPVAAATTGAKRGRKPLKEKKAKDPNAPKRPPSAYLLFQNEVREEVKKTLPPGATYRQILEACSERWKTLPTVEKEDFLRAYQLANQKFVGDEKAYKSGPQAAAFAAQINGAPAIAPPAESSDSSDSDSSDSSDSDDTDARPAPAIAAPRPSVPAQPQLHSPAVSLGAAAAAAAGTPTAAGKKHKKDAGEDGTEKKKKKKSKLSEA